MAESLDREQIGIVLARVPSGCAVVTAASGNRTTGILASWIQQAAFEPPMVTVAIKKGRGIGRLIDESEHFVMNLIGEDPSAIFRHFAKGFALDEPAFEGLATRAIPAGIILESCLGHLACRAVSKIEAGDHWIYVGEIIGGAMHGNAKPYVHVRKSGFNY